LLGRLGCAKAFDVCSEQTTDAAGAIVTGQMFSEAVKRGLDPQDYLTRNDSYTFFNAINGLVITGPTGTNVMDIQLILLEN
jgi:glycerate 2-kinase